AAIGREIRDAIVPPLGAGDASTTNDVDAAPARALLLSRSSSVAMVQNRDSGVQSVAARATLCGTIPVRMKKPVCFCRRWLPGAREPNLIHGSAMGFFGTDSDIALDLGTVNTSIYTRGAVALSEPSVVAFNVIRGSVEAIGTDARDMLGRTPANIKPVWPMRN